jgi:hypothetical protein
MFEKFVKSLQLYYNFNIKYKNESFFMLVLSYILFFNKKFKTNYTTTIGNTIYFPNKEAVLDNEDLYAQILSHELIHIQQKESYGAILYSVLYLFPQILSILSVLAIFSPWCLLFLLFLLPLPAPFRKDFEHSAMSMSLFAFYLHLKTLDITDENVNSTLDKMVNIKKSRFTGFQYWLMWPFGVSFEKEITEIKSGVISKRSELYVRVKSTYTRLFGSNHDE